MSRHGYNEYEGEGPEEQWAHIRWRGAFESARRGKRGQKLLRELLATLDAMETRELISGELVNQVSGSCCAIGSVLLARGVPEPGNMDAWKNSFIATELDVAEILIKEIEWENDEGIGWHSKSTSITASARRWDHMREWVAKQIIDPKTGRSATAENPS